METLDLIQGSREWHAHRATHRNASDAPAMMGVSPYKSREQLLREMATGVVPTPTPDEQDRFAEGHRREALARPLAVGIIGEELYPCVGVEGALSASFDGLTLLEDEAYEHKCLNDRLRDAMVPDCTGADLPIDYQIQMEQQHMVSVCKRILFVASKWKGDDLVEMRHCWYYPNQALAERISRGWAQFEEDLRNYKAPEVAAEVVEARPIQALPALVIQVQGSVVASNLAAYRDAATAFISSIKTELGTDQDFHDAENTVKFCGESEERLAAVKQAALGQTATIDDLFRTIDHISEQFRQKRLALDKLVKARKESLRSEIIADGQSKLDEHIRVLNTRLGATWVPTARGLFAEAIKGKKTIQSCRDAVATALANAKIDASALADRLDANRKTLVRDGADWFFLFADFAVVGAKPVDDFSAIAAMRIQLHRDQEAARAAATSPVAAAAPPTAAAAPAPTPVVSARGERTSQAAADTVDIAGMPCLNLGAIGERLGLSLPADFIVHTLGVPMHKGERNAKFWREAQFQVIVNRLVAHAQSVAKRYQPEAVEA